MSRYSIVVPVYNSEKSIEELYLRTRKVFEEKLNEPFEMIFVDDFSRDNSYRIMERLHILDNRIKIIRLAKNCGQHSALMCGFKYSIGDYIITMDDDLQHPPEEIPKLVKAIKESDKYDVVIGRYEAKKHSFIRNMGTRLSGHVSSKVYGKPKDIELTSFRIIKKFVVLDLLSLSMSLPRIGNMILQVNGRIGNVLVEHDERKYGKSGYTFTRLVRDLINNIITNSNYPLIVVRNLGIGSFGLSIILSLYYLYRYCVKGISIVGWTSMILLILFYSGLTLFSIGVIGDYLIRILNESKKIPNYFIRNIMIDDSEEEKK